MHWPIQGELPKYEIRALKSRSKTRLCRSKLFNTFMLMLHDDANCLDDVRHLREEGALMKLLGLRRLPSSRTLGK